MTTQTNPTSTRRPSVSQAPTSVQSAGDSLAQIAAAFETLRERLAAETSSRGALNGLVEVALRAVPGAEAASVTMYQRGNYSTPASTHDWAHDADHIQYDVDEGPCVEALEQETAFRTGNIGLDERWPVFGPRAAAEQDVGSMLAFRLVLAFEDCEAALNLYSRRLSAFDDAASGVGMLVATHGATAVNGVIDKEKARGLTRALETNRDVGTAMGILMSRHLVTRQQAFDLLAVASQRTNTKLHRIALQVIDAGDLDMNLPHAAVAAALER